MFPEAPEYFPVWQQLDTVIFLTMSCGNKETHTFCRLCSCQSSHQLVDWDLVWKGSLKVLLLHDVQYTKHHDRF